MEANWNLETIEPYIRREISGTVYKNVSGFHRFFPDIKGPEWDCALVHDSSCSCEARASESLNTRAWPKLPNQRAVINWFRNFNEHLVGGRTRFYSAKDTPMEDSESGRKCDLFLSSCDNGEEFEPKKGQPFSMYAPWVVGELKESPQEDCKHRIVVQVVGYAREIFGIQVCRRFVHGFTICGDIFRCYLFDRVGVSISTSFRIGTNEKTLKLFTRILLGYSKMQPEDLGFDPNYKAADGEPFIPTKSHPIPAYMEFQNHKYHLSSKLFHQSSVVSRGTLCWLAKDEAENECVVKDSWRCKGRTSEGDLLFKAREKKVWGVVECRQHGDVIVGNDVDEIMSNIRQGLSYEAASQVTVLAMLSDRFRSLSTTTSSGHLSSGSLKRKLSQDHGSSTPKRSKSLDRPSAQSPPGRDRTHTCLIIYTIGENICEFLSVKELLEALRDAIKCTFSALNFFLLSTSNYPQVINRYGRMLGFCIAMSRSIIS